MLLFDMNQAHRATQKANTKKEAKNRKTFLKKVKFAPRSHSERLGVGIMKKSEPWHLIKIDGFVTLSTTLQK